MAAIKSTAELLVDIAALIPLIDDTELKSVLSDMVVSLAGTSSGFHFDPDPTDNLSGDTAKNHALRITVVKCFVIENTSAGNVIHEPTITIVDNENLTIHWAGTDLVPESVYYLGF